MGQYRKEKVAERIREILTTVFRYHTKDPRLDGLYVVDVRVSGDLRYARVYWRSELGLGQGQIEAGLAKAHGYLRRQVAEQLNIRFAPELTFERDTTLERGARVLEILARVAPAPPEETSPDTATEAGDETRVEPADEEASTPEPEPADEEASTPEPEPADEDASEPDQAPADDAPERP